MKRRLQRAYDSMTMPDSCAQRIEERLRQQEKAQKNGKYVKIVAPEPVRRRNWAAVAAVCLMLVLSVGGSVLFLSGVETAPVQATAPVRETIPATKPAPGDYSLVTDISGEDVEAFVAEVRQNVIDGDWEAFSKKVQYPITILDKRIGAGGLVELTLRNTINETFVYNIQAGGSNQLFCNWQGICMGDGNIWINEVEGELKITAINDMFAYFADSEDFVFAETEFGAVAITAYDGMAEEITLPIGYNQRTVTQIGTGRPVIRNGNAVKILWIPESVAVIGEKAFANAPALKSVFFRGDAPPEAEGVFEGSANVTVYYRPETKGWGDTWCGRPTMQYGEGHVSLGVATVKIDQEAAYQALTEILNEEREFFTVEHQSRYTITEYCEKRTKSMGREVTAPYFTMVDMDRDGIKELIVQIRIEGDLLEDYLILRYTDSTDGEGFVYTYFEPQQKITDLRKDGSFYYREGGPGQGDSRLALDLKKGIMVVSSMGVSGADSDSEPVWHAWPCVRPEAVVQSYEFAGTNQNHFPSVTYSVFEAILYSRANNDWTYWKEEMTRWGMICKEDGSEVSVYDPDAPGCRMFGTLDTEGRLAYAGYYISNQYGEREAKVRLGLSDAPLYIIGSHLAELDAHGIEVVRPEEVQDYLGAVPDDFQSTNSQETDRTVEHEAIRKVLTAFVEGCTAKDTKGLAQYLTEDYSGTIPEELAGMRVQIISFVNFPDGAVEEGECLEVSLSLAEVENPAELHRLNVEIIKTAEGWKIHACELAE